MECTILSAEQWSCKISLRAGKSTADQQYSPPLGPMDDVELWIRRAQATVLCPHLPDDTFKEMGREEIKAKTNSDADPNVFTVTKSVVVIDIEDPSGADLSFVDLPGTSSRGLDKASVLMRLERARARPERRYVGSQACERLGRGVHLEAFDIHLGHHPRWRYVCFLCTTTQSTLRHMRVIDDMENQQAAKLAKEADSEGKRTIGGSRHAIMLPHTCADRKFPQGS